MTISVVPHSDLDTLHSRLLAEIPDGSSVLDVGAGLAKYHELLIAKGCKLTLVDAHEPYLAERAARFPAAAESGQVVLMPRKATALPGSFYHNPFDVALAIDFIEHLDRDEARAVVMELCFIAQKVILFTPEGNHPQTTDGYNMGGDHWQTHRSTWEADDPIFASFATECWLDFHRWASDKGCDPGAIWAVWERKS